MKKKTKNILQKIFIYGFAVIAIAIIKNVGMPQIDSFLVDSIIFLSIIVAAIYINIIIHELGHTIFGLVTGYKFNSMKIGIFVFEIKDNKKIFKIDKKYPTGGYVKMSYPNMDDEGNYPFLLHSYGGVIANMILAIIFIIILFFLTEKSFFKTFSLTMVFTSIVSIIGNLIPSFKDNMRSDGYRINKLKNNIDFRKANWAIDKISDELSNDIRIREVDSSYFNMLKDINLENIYDDILLTSGISYFLALRLLDELKIKEADIKINEILENEEIKMLEVFKTKIVFEGIFLDILNNKDKEYIDNKINGEIEKHIDDNPEDLSVLRFSYAYELIINKNIEKSLELKEKFNKLVNKSELNLDIKMEKDLINLVDEN